MMQCRSKCGGLCREYPPPLDRRPACVAHLDSWTRRISMHPWPTAMHACVPTPLMMHMHRSSRHRPVVSSDRPRRLRPPPLAHDAFVDTPLASEPSAYAYSSCFLLPAACYTSVMYVTMRVSDDDGHRPSTTSSCTCLLLWSEFRSLSVWQ